MTSSLTQPQAQPAERHIFAPARDRHGTRLALVFGNQAPGGKCPYYVAAKCWHCDIGAGEGGAFTTEMNRQRLAWYREHFREVLSDTAHLLLYNSGSLLNRREMPAELLDELLAWAGSLPVLKVVSLESRENAVTASAVQRAVEMLGAGKELRMVIGLESSDDRIRNDVLAKSMPRGALLRAVENVGQVAAGMDRGRVGLTSNILAGGPGTTEQTAVADAVQTAEFALQAGRDADVQVDLNLHPYYRSARAAQQFPDHPRCSVKVVVAAATAIAKLIAASELPSGLFIGLYDEGHDQDPASASWSNSTVRDLIARFNEIQDASCFESLL